jgi:pimeloyl-ACP methyl ester carboxylesterase
MEPYLDLTQLRHGPCGIMREPIRLLGFKISDVYGKFIEHVQKQLADDVRVIEYSYDWRLSVEHNARKLHEELNRELPGQTVDVVAHSFGGLVARYFIQNLGGANRVRHLITMGTPHRGSVDTFESLYEGWGSNSLKDAAVNLWMGGTREFRKTLLTFPGFYDMMPDGGCCWFSPPSGGKAQQFDPFDITAWARFSFYKEVFPGPSDQAFLKHQLHRAWTLHDKTLKAGFPPSHKMDHRLIVTGWIDTITRVYLDERTGELLKFERKQGDGTVSLYSATNEIGLSDPSISYSPREHMQIFIEKAAMETVARILVGGFPTRSRAQLTPRMTERIRTRDGKLLEVRSLGYEVSPGAAGPGAPLRLTVRLTGENALSTADLSNIVAKLDALGPVDLPLAKVDDSRTPVGTVVLAIEFKAPERTGAHIVRLSIPGIGEDYQDVFIVVGD